MDSIPQVCTVAPGRMAYYPTDVTDWTITDLDASLIARAEQIGYYWDHAKLEMGQWEHTFGYTWQTLAIERSISRSKLQRWIVAMEDFYRFQAELRRLGWQSPQRNLHEWDQLTRCRRDEGDVAALVRSFRERAAQEQQHAELWKQYARLCEKLDIPLAIGKAAAPLSRKEQITNLQESIAAVEAYRSQLDAEEMQRTIRNIKRWHKQKLSRNEMVHRMGGDRNAALKLIRVVLYQADAK